MLTENRPSQMPRLPISPHAFSFFSFFLYFFYSLTVNLTTLRPSEFCGRIQEKANLENKNTCFIICSTCHKDWVSYRER